MFSRRTNRNNEHRAYPDNYRSRKVKAAGNRWSGERVQRVAPKAKVRADRGGSDAGRDWSRARLVLVGMVFLLVWTGLWGRAWFLQIHESEMLSAMADRQHLASETITGQRGEILDRNGKVLARSVEVSSVYINPREITDAEGTATVLAEVLGLQRNQVARRMQSDKGFVWMARKVPDAAAQEIASLKLPGVYLTTEYERAYPYKQLAGQLLGFVGMDDKGLEGLERSFDSVLSGRSGSMTLQRDAAGRRLYLEGLNAEDELTGRNVRLTLDTQIQYFAEDALAKAVVNFGGKWGGCLVIDVPTGEILAWAEYPFFNPNAYRDYQPSMWRSRLAMDALEQGSTTKPFLVAAALSENVIAPDTVFYCEKGIWKHNKTTIRDTRSHENLPINKILSYSSNIGAAKIGLELGTDKYYAYLNNLGFGQKTGLPVPGESLGILRNPKQWSETDLINASFGQSFSATGVQMAQAYLTLAAGGVNRPLKLVLSEWDTESVGVEEEQIFKPEAAAAVLSMLREVVEEDGTGQRARISIPGIVVGGKTGTAQKAEGKSYGEARMASFVGIEPLNDPRYLVLVMVDEPRKNVYGGVVAAPVFRQVITHTLAYRGELPEEKLELAENEQDVISEGTQVALAAKEHNGKTETSEVLDRLLPMPKETRNAEIDQTAPGITPNVVGKSVRRAVEAFLSQGIMPVVKGEGRTVAKQEPEAGTPLAANAEAKCVLWLTD